MSSCKYVDEVVPYVTKRLGRNTSFKIDVRIIGEEYRWIYGKAYCEQRNCDVLQFLDTIIPLQKPKTRIQMKIKEIVVSGQLGTHHGYCLNARVTVVDINADRIAAWNADDLDQLPAYEPGLKEVVAEARGRNLFFSTDVEGAIERSEMIFMAVNTPTKTYGEGKGMAADLTYVEKCAREIARVATTDKIVVEKSTLPVRTAEKIKEVLEGSGNGVSFEVLSNPEFLAEGTAIQDYLNPIAY